MFTKLALSAALALGTASAALAATKHHVRHDEQTTIQKQVTPGYNPYNAYGYQAPRAGGETYIDIQDKFYRESN